MPALKALHLTDPRQDLWKKVGKLDWIKIRSNQILVAVYERPTEAQYGTMKIHLADKTKEEDRYQGKVGLVIKMGPLAFVDDDDVKFQEHDKCKVGDWIVFRASDGWQLTLTGDGSNAQLCRVFVEADIKAVITSPDQVW
jgi:hypothetical protein